MRYAIVKKQNGEWETGLLVVEYDWDKAARHAEVNDRTDWAKALRTESV